MLAIGGVGRRNECMFWLAPNNITSPHDLVGKTVANYDAADDGRSWSRTCEAPGCRTNR